MEEKTVNLDKIMKMSANDFKKHLAKWLLDQDMSRELQAKLRKNLIENFNNTHLGKKIKAQHNQNKRVVLSPLTLILNTLVAEFLYAQNCHYSLSVFCTEIPYQIILPDFEQRINFRFSREDIIEILEAVDGGNLNENIKNLIVNKYIQLESTDKLAPSCLYVIFETLFKSVFIESKPRSEEVIHENNAAKSEKLNSNVRRWPIKHISINTKKIYMQNFRYLKKYLKVLANKIKEISKCFRKLQKNYICSPDTNTGVNHKIDQFNKKLDKISQLFLKQNKNRYSSIVSVIYQMSKQFETCISHFKDILQTNIELKQNNHSGEKNYSEWVSELNETKSGKKFLLKVESSIQKILTKEKRRMLNIFTEKLENEKKLLKLKYKQRYLDSVSMFDFKKSNIENLQKSMKMQSSDVNNIEINEKEENDELKESSTIVRENTTKILDESVKRHDEIAKQWVQQERYTDSIVHEAKLRIQELEHESLKIDNTFKEYLLKQQYNKIEAKQNVGSIWDKYNLEKTILYKKCKILQNKPKTKSSEIIGQQEKLETKCYSTPEIYIELEPDTSPIFNREDETDTPSVENIEFENPFKKFQFKIPTNLSLISFQNSETSKLHNHSSIKDFNETKLEITNKFLSKIENRLQFNLDQQNKHCETTDAAEHSPKPIKQKTKKDEITLNNINRSLSTPNLFNKESVSRNSNEGDANFLINFNESDAQQSTRTDNQENSNSIKNATKNINREQDSNKIFQISSFSKNTENGSPQNSIVGSKITRENLGTNFEMENVGGLMPKPLNTSNSNNSNSSISVISTKNESIYSSNEY